MPRRREPVWAPQIVVEALHFDQIREHGGMQGLRDEGALESCLARPRNRWRYDPKADLAALAAAYGFGIVRNHPFNDGNKRAAFLTMVVFLEINGRDFDAGDEAVVATMIRVASGVSSEEELSSWVRRNPVPPPERPPRR